MLTTLDALERIAFSTGAPLLLAGKFWTVRVGRKVYKARA